MNTPHPEQRAIACRLLTDAGWLEGTVHVPLKAHLTEYLNRGDPLFRLTDVALPGRRERLPFFALVRQAVIAVAPTSPAEKLTLELGPRQAHQVELLLPGGATLQGQVDALANTRISDYLVRHTGFVPVSGCVFRAGSPGALASAAEFPGVLLQVSRAIGVSEVAPG